LEPLKAPNLVSSSFLSQQTSIFDFRKQGFANADTLSMMVRTKKTFMPSFREVITVTARLVTAIMYSFVFHGAFFSPLALSQFSQLWQSLRLRQNQHLPQNLMASLPSVQTVCSGNH
jgi:hypothetical protein